MQDRIQGYAAMLRAEGYGAKILADGDISFDKDGAQYSLHLSKRITSYLKIDKRCPITGQRIQLLEAANLVNCKVKAAKALIRTSSVVFTVEGFYSSAHEFSQHLEDIIICLNLCEDSFQEALIH